MDRLNHFSTLDAITVARAVSLFGTPVYVYDERDILERCRECLNMPNAYGLTVRYAMKANSNKTLLKIISGAGLHIDASSMAEARRALLAGIPPGHIMLTTQEVYTGGDMETLEHLLSQGVRYNVSSLRQLRGVCDWAGRRGIDLGIRVHPGVGSGESSSRDTGSEYACFGVHLKDAEEAADIAKRSGVKFTHMHEHIGSGADTEVWRDNIERELDIAGRFFPDAVSVSFGGGLKAARMPDERGADIERLGACAKRSAEEFFVRTGRRIRIEIEPGTYITANSGYALTRVIDKKSTLGANFVILDGGMNINARPLMYGSRHPIYIVSGGGKRVKSSEFAGGGFDGYEAVVAGICCETGDCQTLDREGKPRARAMREPEVGDIAVIGGVGAYCAAMTPFNYNSHTQAPEALFTVNGELKLIRRRQTLEQMTENELTI